VGRRRLALLTHPGDAAKDDRRSNREMSGTRRGQSTDTQSRAWVQRIGRLLPIVGELGSYRRAWLMRDSLAAVTICAVLVPQALAYGQLAGLISGGGSYAALVPLILYPLSPARGG